MIPRQNRRRPRPRRLYAAAVRILRIADVSDQPGGMQGYMRSSGAELEAMGHEVSYWFREDLSLPGPARLRRLLVPVQLALGVARQRDDFDVVEIHEPLAAVYLLVARILRLPPCTVLSYGLEERSWTAFRSRQRRKGKTISLKSRVLVPLTLLSQARFAVRHADAVAVPSTEDRRHLRTAARVASERIVFAPTGVAPEFFAIEREERRAGASRLLFVGSWIDRKGTPELVEMWRGLREENAPATLTLAGVAVPAERVFSELQPPEREGIRVLKELRRDELPRLLGRHDIFVLPSWFEGLPLSLLEAAAAGLPCVACNVCGNLDVFRPADPEADGGILIPPHDAEALLAAVLRLIRDQHFAVALGRRARDRVREFTWRNTAEQLLSAYETAAAPRFSRTAASATR